MSRQVKSETGVVEATVQFTPDYREDPAGDFMEIPVELARPIPPSMRRVRSVRLDYDRELPIKRGDLLKIHGSHVHENYINAEKLEVLADRGGLGKVVTASYFSSSRR